VSLFYDSGLAFSFSFFDSGFCLKDPRCSFAELAFVYLHYLAFRIWSFLIFRLIFYTKLPPDSDISNAFRCFSNSSPLFCFQLFPIYSL
jgi:hypothetical protein